MIKLSGTLCIYSDKYIRISISRLIAIENMKAWIFRVQRNVNFIIRFSIIEMRLDTKRYFSKRSLTFHSVLGEIIIATKRIDELLKNSTPTMTLLNCSKLCHDFKDLTKLNSH